jgi:Rho GDP-dissociation inhibitor
MAEADDAVEQTPGYVAPKKVALDTLKDLDKDDEALNRWKAQLLAGVSKGACAGLLLILIK